MNVELIKHKKRAVVEKFGQWTAHNIKLDGEIYTIDDQIIGDEIKLRRIVQIISDIAGRPLEGLRVLDLACLEGLYAIELARHGARVLAIEGREANLEKARFAKEVLSLDSLELVQDDVRNLSKEKHGYFDVVLCLGILYHLDVPDVFYFLEKIAQVCQGFTIIDTHVSATPEKFHLFKGRKYWGKTFREHSTNSTPEERARELWMSLDNPTSFWFTRPSIYSVLSHLEFTSVYECHKPFEPNKPNDRITLLAMKGQRQTLISSPRMNAQPDENWPEESSYHGTEKQSGRLYNVGRLLKNRIKKIIRSLIDSLLHRT